MQIFQYWQLCEKVNRFGRIWGEFQGLGWNMKSKKYIKLHWSTDADILSVKQKR